MRLLISLVMFAGLVLGQFNSREEFGKWQVGLAKNNIKGTRWAVAAVPSNEELTYGRPAVLKVSCDANKVRLFVEANVIIQPDIIVEYKSDVIFRFSEQSKIFKQTMSITSSGDTFEFGGVNDRLKDIVTNDFLHFQFTEYNYRGRSVTFDIREGKPAILRAINYCTSGK